MSEKFNWQMEDDHVWEEPSPQSQVKKPGKRRSWLYLLLLFIVVGGAATAVYRQVADRVESTITDREQDVLIAHNLLLFANQEQDTDLFVTVLSGRDDIWSQSQRDAVGAGQLYDTPALGLHRLSPKIDLAAQALTRDDLAITDVRFNPDLTAVELHFTQKYWFNAGNGLTETVELEQTALYRRGNQRWLFAPPLSEFWGNSKITTAGSRLTATYPERDREIGERLAHDLDQALADMCQQLVDISCSPELHIYLSFDTDAGSLARIQDPIQMLSSGLRQTLPAPTLVGLPRDEAGYQALYRGYAGQVLATTILYVAGWECCHNLLFSQALVDYALDQLGIRPWPIDVEMYRQILLQPSVDVISGAWLSIEPAENELDLALAYTVVDFLTEQDPSLFSISMLPPSSPRPSFRSWVKRYFDTGLDVDLTDDEILQRFFHQWRAFGAAYVLDNDPPPIPLPAQDIALLCQADSLMMDVDVLVESPIGIYLYNPAEASWQIKEQPAGFAFLAPLRLPDSFLMQVLGWETELFEGWLWRGGSDEPHLVYRVTEPSESVASLGQMSPDGRYLLAVPIAELEASLRLFDLQDCTLEGCAAASPPGVPVWSPDQRRVIWIESREFFAFPMDINGRLTLFSDIAGMRPQTLLLSDFTDLTTLEEGLEEEIGIGSSPFWLDDERFGFIRYTTVVTAGAGLIPHPAGEIVLASVDDPRPQRLVGLDDLLSFIPDADANTSAIVYALTSSQRPDVLIIGIWTANTQTLSVLSYDLASGASRLLLQLDQDFGHILAFSPDGEGLLAFSPGSEQLVLHDFEQETNRTYQWSSSSGVISSVFDWSADGLWLAGLLNDQTLSLLAPAYDYEIIIPHDQGLCSSLAWGAAR